MSQSVGIVRPTDSSSPTGRLFVVTRSKQRSVGCKAPTLVVFESVVASASVSSKDDDIHSSLQGVFIPGRSLGD